MPLVDIIHRLRQRPWLGILLGLAIFVVAFGARIALEPVLHGQPFVTLYPAIVIAGLLGGVRLGFAITVLGAILAWYWLLPKVGSFEPTWGGIVSLALFCLSSTILLYIVHALDSAIETVANERDRAAVLLRELDHRTGNNMAFLSSLVNLQRRANSNPEAMSALNSISQRIDTIIRIHRSLYEPTGADRSLLYYLDDLCTSILKATNAKHITCAVEVTAAELDTNRSVLLSRLVAELMTNSIKHAFTDRANGSITVRLEEDESRYVLTVSDDGNGLPDDFNSASSQGLGMHIVEGLTKQLDGEIVWSKTVGTTVRLSFPVQAASSTDRVQASF